MNLRTAHPRRARVAVILDDDLFEVAEDEAEPHPERRTRLEMTRANITATAPKESFR